MVANTPRGDEEPTARHANFGKPGWEGYTTLTVAGDHEAGKSPYGVYDLAGNVWEWTSSDSGIGYKVVRGGAWHIHDEDFLASTYSIMNHPTDRSLGIGFRCAMDAR